MPKLTLPRTLFAAGVVAVAVAAGVGLFANRAAKAQPVSQPPTVEAWKDLTYTPSSKCASCHALPLPEYRAKAGKKTAATDFVLLTESSIWRAYDKHAQAYAVLEGDRGKLIGRLLYGEKNEDKVLKAEAGCISCHAMNNLSLINKANGADELDVRDGVSCTGCHGPSDKKRGAPAPVADWFGDHSKDSWRDNSPDAKFHRGMRNVRDPAVRAELCMSCHIGSATEGKVVTHAMMAAGHPPLPPIELATFSRNEPQHWRLSRHVPWLKKNKDNPAIRKNYDLENMDFQQTRAALIGSVVALRETLKLARDRASFSKKGLWVELDANPTLGKDPAERWPEIAMAHSDCYACHHDLRYPGYRQERGFGYHVPGTVSARVIPGRPIVRLWPLGGLSAALIYTGKAGKATDLRTRLDKLVAATNARPFGDPKELVSSADELITWCDEVIKDLSGAKFTAEQVRATVDKLCEVYGGKDSSALPDYETARQVVSILRVALGELKDAGAKVNDKALKELETIGAKLNVEPYFNRGERLKIMRDVLWNAFNPDKLDKPAETFVASSSMTVS